MRNWAYPIVVGNSNMKKVLIILICIFSFADLKAQSESLTEDLEQIPWSSDYKLKWSDFKGVKDSLESRYDDKYAACASEILATPEYDSGTLVYRVTNNFHPNSAWVIDSITMGAIGLEHEQIHFDIAEVYTRLIRSRIEEMVRNKK